MIVDSPMRRAVLAALAALAATPLARGQADAFPQGQMKIVVPYSPGGGTDILGRALAQQLGELLHRTVIVDNRTGANGTIGAAYVAKSPPDGLTMLIVPAGYAANPAMYKSLPYDESRDFAPVSLLASGPLVLVVHPSLGVHSVKELIALAKSKPGQINVGNAGIGSLPHLSAELFNVQAGVKLVSVPYKGAGPALVDVMAGRVPVYFMNILQALPVIKQGQLIALGVTTPQASPIAPDIPPIASEVPGFDMTNWYGMLVPAGTSAATVHALQRSLATVLTQPDIKQKMYNEGMTVVASTPEQFAQFLGRETDKYNRIIESAGIKNSL
ncbi:MAG TPA: tripartite tricarboxylate transporter substrate binding protein [Casimicrobiaceae bacterium]|jgi:tripartite-type tricarboxylate transporter receptor subunit TctC|nr:tripartite tricarboxylate transporter substrate binding protein [Casimicrobiaceae bacterium]